MSLCGGTFSSDSSAMGSVRDVDGLFLVFLVVLKKILSKLR